jgi:hypothetical protein
LIDGVIDDESFKLKNNEIDSKLALIDDEIKKVSENIGKVQDMEDRFTHLSEALSSDKIQTDVKFNLLLDNIRKVVVYPDHADIEINIFGNYTIEGDFSKCVQCA